jgi:hypothetical protein
MKNTKAEKAIKAAARVLAAVLSTMFIFGATACQSEEPTIQRLSPSDSEGTDREKEKDEDKEETTTAERDEEFVYTYVTAPKPTTENRVPDEYRLQNDGDVVTCYSWNEEFTSLVEDYYLVDKPLNGVIFDKVITTGTFEYQQKLDADLLSGEEIDMFLAESNFVAKYTNTPYALSIADLGITEAELQYQYPFAKAIGTDLDGVMRASAFQVCPEVIVYRRSIAEDVLGVSEPEDVQPFLKDTENFEATAKKMAAGGKKMVSSYGDLFYSYVNTSGEPIVDVGSLKITIPEAWMDWVDDTMTYTQNGYNNKTYMWSTEWQDDVSGNEVFCFQGPPWFVNFTLQYAAGGSYGDWAVVPGPVNTYWDGAYLLAGANTDNADIVADIIRYFTTDADSMERVERNYAIGPNSIIVNERLGKDTMLSSGFLGGQNPYDVYNEVASGINPEIAAKQSSKYGELCETFQAAFTDYYDGVITKEEALDIFYLKATFEYPELTY